MAGFHLDNPLWSFSSPLATTAWVALDDATETNGCLHFAPGSHRAVMDSGTPYTFPANTISDALGAETFVFFCHDFLPRQAPENAGDVENKRVSICRRGLFAPSAVRAGTGGMCGASRRRGLSQRSWSARGRSEHDDRSAACDDDRVDAGKQTFLAPFCTQNDHITKTGSAQT